MSEDRFPRAYALLAVHEGGYIDHPDDPGGATNKGVTQRTYDNYRRRNGLDIRDVRSIADAEVETIYRNQYWNAVKANELPPGVAYCVFDAAVNSGPGRAARWLQSCIGAQVDGIVGDETVSRAWDMDRHIVIDLYCDKRFAFMKSLPHWRTFKDGWTRRVAEVRAKAKLWAEGQSVVADHVADPVPGKAVGPKSETSVLLALLKDKVALGAAGSILGTGGTLASGSGPIQYAIAAVLIIGALGFVWWLFRGREA